MDYQPQKQYDAQLGSAILYVLSWHQGRDRAIGRDDLVHSPEIRATGFGERVVRDTIRLLRRQGHLICSTPGVDGGYYLAADWEEFNEFARAEYQAKIADMAETLAAMKAEATRRWGSALQMSLL